MGIFDCPITKKIVIKLSALYIYIYIYCSLLFWATYIGYKSNNLGKVYEMIWCYGEHIGNTNFHKVPWLGGGGGGGGTRP